MLVCAAALAGVLALAAVRVFTSRTVSETPAGTLRRETLLAAEELVRRYPDQLPAITVSARAHFEFHELTEAERLWNRALALDRDSVTSRIGLAYVAMDRGDYHRAVALYREAVTIDSTNEDARFGLAESLQHLGRLDEAVAALGEVEPDRRESFPALVLLAQIEMERQQYGRAEEAFQAAVNLAPQSPQPHYGLSQVCSRTGKRAEAAQHARQFRELSAAQGQTDSSPRGVVADIVRTQRSAVRLFVAIAHVYAELGDSQQAQYCRDQAVALGGEM